ncbi:MAG: MFS transporter [Oscillospiraceae bacterium]|nr:MFS transporter [Oscillospiraceae bacterium]
MSTNPFKRTKLACYTAYFTMSTVFSLPPLLFVTLRELYGISYTLLGTLVLINFCTQLSIDLIFTFFSRRFPVGKTVKIMPLITSLGLVIYAVTPMLFPEYAYVGLVIGTVIFSVSAGLSEVLLSPLIAAIPSKTPQRDMSMLHSLHAFGVFTVVVVSTAFLKLLGTENWMYLTLFLATWPVLAAIMFMRSPIPEMQTGGSYQGTVDRSREKTVGLVLCAASIFFGSCSENVMSNWISGFMENALHIDKAVGDILGMAMFAVLLGVARILYARFGKNICRVLLAGMIGASVCYFIVSFSANTMLVFFACIFVGLFTSMLWPGSLIMMEENVPGAGVAAFALMAASGDLGASVAPQLMGIVVDQVSVSEWAAQLAPAMSLTAEQVGMKTGMLVSSVFPVLGTVVLLLAIRHFRRQKIR